MTENKRNGVKRPLLVAILSTAMLLPAISAASAALIIDSNWRYTRANTSSTSDAGAARSLLSFLNSANRTSATASGTAYADEDVFGGNQASVDLTYTFDFSVVRPKRALELALADNFSARLRLEDTERSGAGARVASNVVVRDRTTGALVAGLPSRFKSRRSQGTSAFTESALFSDHIFRLSPGQYRLQAFLDIDAIATRGIGDDRVRSTATYNIQAQWKDIPVPATSVLLVLGMCGLGLLNKCRKQTGREHNCA